MAYNQGSMRPPSDRLCAFFNTPGGCRRGKGCTFTHATDPNAYQASGPDTGRDHNGRICTFWSEMGFCKRGDTCNFKHIGPGGVQGGGPMGPPMAMTYPDRYAHGTGQANGGGGPPICSFWANRGMCKKGESCDFSHAAPPGTGSGMVSLYNTMPRGPSAMGQNQRYGYEPMESGPYPPPLLQPMGSQRMGGGRGMDMGMNPNRLPQPRPKFCAYYSVGKCKKGPSCDFLHAVMLGDDEPMPERRVCSYFRDGTCKKGNTCDHLHVLKESEKEEVEKRLEVAMTQKHRAVCPFYWTTTCKKGAACDNAHLMPKERVPASVRVCQFFESSLSCKKHNTCDFLHVVDRPLADMPADLESLFDGRAQKRELEERAEQTTEKRVRTEAEPETQ